jgi:hypothetical protein
MTNRLFQSSRGSNKYVFSLIFLTSFFYKLTLAWRSGIAAGWQDEIGWRNFAANHSFLTTITEFDSGYPTPVIRGVSFILAQLTTTNFLIWHIIVLICISISIASIAFSHLLNNQSKILVGGILCSFPSFDLLLLHNLSYWAYIPLFIALTNVIAMKVELNTRLLFLIFSLIIAASKPQILISAFALIFISILVNSQLRVRLASLTFPILILFLIGRYSSSSLSLDLDIDSSINYLLTICAHFLLVSTPIPTLVFFAIAKYSGFSFVILLYFVFATGVTFYIFFKSRVGGKSSILVFSIAVSFAVGLSSLYIFANSGWSQNNLLFSDEYLSLFSRHYLPIILNVVFLILLRFCESKYANYLILSAILQNVFLQVVLFEQFYQPI